MSDQAIVPADVNSESAASGDVDAQLAQMQTAEQAGEQTGEQKPAADAAQTEEGQQQQQKTVPLQALHEARNETRALRQQLAQRDRETQEQMARVNQRLEQLFRPQQQVPDKETNAVDYLDHKLTEVAEGQRQIVQRDQMREQQAAQAQHVQALVSRVVGAERELAAKTPDYEDAVKHLDSIRIRELQVLGLPEEQAVQHAVQERQQAALEWAHRGLNPAQVAYELAKTRGYTPRTQTADQKVDGLQRGTQAARSLGNGGSTGGGKLTAEALAKMTDEDFSKLTESQFRQAMGG